MLYPNTEVRMDSIKKMRPKYPANTGTRYITPDHIIYKSIQKGNKKNSRYNTTRKPPNFSSENHNIQSYTTTNKTLHDQHIDNQRHALDRYQKMAKTLKGKLDI